MASKRKALDPVTDYAKKVISGKIVAGRLVRLACQRHLNDLKDGKKRGLWFDAQEAEDIFEFFGYLRHSKGEWAGQPVELELWQKFVIGSVFGWKKKNGFRRFTTVYEQIARKNGKSTKAAGIGLWGLLMDDEPGAEIYSAATKKDQAKITHSEAIRMVRKSEELRDEIKIYKDNLNVEETASKFEPLGANEDTMDGLNVHMGLVDELHAHPTRAVWEVLGSAVGARRQPLMYAITTAGFNTNGICYELYEFSRKVLEGVTTDDSHFAYVAELDAEDRWDDPNVWIKANPNLGVSVYREQLERDAAKAAAMPASKNNFLVKHCNRWTSAASNWIPRDLWLRNIGNMNTDELLGKECYGGLDLSSTTDLAAFVLAFPIDGRVKLLPFFYLPEEGIDERSKADHVEYRLWAEKGLLTLTPGDYIDYSYIERDIKKARELYDLKEIAFDPYNASSFTQDLAKDEEIEMVQVRQGFLSMSPPSKEFFRMLKAGEIEHGGHEVLGWNADNTVVIQDAAENIKPDKKKARMRIDGIVASIMAISRVMFRDNDGSAYESKGFAEL